MSRDFIQILILNPNIYLFIANISDNTFVDLVNLEILKLHNNKIVNISNYLFANQTQLVFLDLTMNKISRVQLRFLYVYMSNISCRKSTKLKIKYLLYFQIESHAFTSLTNLQELLLGQNSLSSIPVGLFLKLEKLKRLMLFSNNLATLDSNSFIGLKNLKHLLLNNNILKNFAIDVFRPLQKLEKL